MFAVKAENMFSNQVSDKKFQNQLTLYELGFKIRITSNELNSAESR
jgi:hypothetical protein